MALMRVNYYFIQHYIISLRNIILKCHVIVMTGFNYVSYYSRYTYMSDALANTGSI